MIASYLFLTLHYKQIQIVYNSFKAGLGDLVQKGRAIQMIREKPNQNILV